MNDVYSFCGQTLLLQNKHNSFLHGVGNVQEQPLHKEQSYRTP